MYYPSSESKGADQLRGNREADLRLCFRMCKIRFSHDAKLICVFVFAYAKIRFSYDAAQFRLVIVLHVMRNSVSFAVCVIRVIFFSESLTCNMCIFFIIRTEDLAALEC